MTGWDHPDTADRYEHFCRHYARYRRANEVLVREAELVTGLRVLDFGAGTGRTASAALTRLGRDGTIVCVEPAAAMRAAGQRRLQDSRVTWRADLPCHRQERVAFDRVLAGAVIWQLDSVDDGICQLAALLRPGGALAFNVPALYLGEPDDAGGGADPLLLDLMTLLACESAARRAWTESTPPAAWQYRRDDIDAALQRAGLRYRTWEFRHRLTQVAYARWLSIPVVTDWLLAEVDAAERQRRIECTLDAVDRDSFKWERWRGWTAWKC
jgi:SAM-dependent methyltransferase